MKLAIQDAFTQHGCTADEFIVSHGAQSAIGHDMGSGEIQAGEPIVIDLWPKDARDRVLRRHDAHVSASARSRTSCASTTAS